MSDRKAQPQQEPGAPQVPDEAPAVGPAAGLPVASLRDAIPHLRRPFSPEAVRFKVQTVFKEAKGCIVVAYIDARLVVERLNAVVADNWQQRYREVDGKPNLLWCDLSVDGRTRPDLGEGQGAADGMRYKAAVSDSLKRAAVQFGIGVSVYALPQITLFANQPHVEAARTAKGPSLKLTELGHKKLREGYAKWLEEHGERLFGPVLDHGDVEGHTIDEEVEAPEFVPERPPALEDERALALIEEARGVYGNFDAHERARVSPGKFNGWLIGAQHSHEELEKLVEYLRALRDRTVAA